MWMRTSNSSSAWGDWKEIGGGGSGSQGPQGVNGAQGPQGATGAQGATGSASGASFWSGSNTGGNCNTMTTPGCYSGSWSSNQPSGASWGTLLVLASDVSTSYREQVFIPEGGTQMWFRGSPTAAWIELTNQGGSGSVTGANLSGQASAYGQAANSGSAVTFARSDHYHALPARLVSTTTSNAAFPLLVSQDTISRTYEIMLSNDDLFDTAYSEYYNNTGSLIANPRYFTSGKGTVFNVPAGTTRILIRAATNTSTATWGYQSFSNRRYLRYYQITNNGNTTWNNEYIYRQFYIRLKFLGGETNIPIQIAAKTITSNSNYEISNRNFGPMIYFCNSQNITDVRIWGALEGYYMALAFPESDSSAYYNSPCIGQRFYE